MDKKAVQTVSADFVFIRAVMAIVVMAATTTSLVLVAVYTA